MEKELNINGKIYVLKEQKEDKASKQDENGNIDCHNNTYCHNSTSCDNSTSCHNSTFCVYCNNLILEKFMIFNKQIDSKEEFNKIKYKIKKKLGQFKHPKQLTNEDKKWLKENIEQYDEQVLNEIIEKSILPDKHK